MTSLNSSINSNGENPAICFCSLKAIEKNCGECSYMLSKEVKQINAYLYQNQKQLLINLQQQQIEQQNQNYFEEQIKKSGENYVHNFCEVVNIKEFRKCVCQFPSREIQCYRCSYGIPTENEFSENYDYDDNSTSNNNRDNEKEDDFINECINKLSQNQIESFEL
ncbi:hypothetical protein ACTFIV_007568 [Dictyostelium citrinum]